MVLSTPMQFWVLWSGVWHSLIAVPGKIRGTPEKPSFSTDLQKTVHENEPNFEEDLSWSLYVHQIFAPQAQNLFIKLHDFPQNPPEISGVPRAVSGTAIRECHTPSEPHRILRGIYLLKRLRSCGRKDRTLFDKLKKCRKVAKLRIFLYNNSSPARENSTSL